MKKWALLVALALSSPCFAGADTNWAVPTRIDVVRNEGLMVWGSFGNAMGCVAANSFFISISHPQYNQIYAALLAAMSNGWQVSAYIDVCAAENWYSVPSTTYNWLDSCCALYIQQP